MKPIHIPTVLLLFLILSLLGAVALAVPEDAGGSNPAVTENAAAEAGSEPTSAAVRRALIICGHPGDSSHRTMYSRTVDTLYGALTDRYGCGLGDVQVLFGAKPQKGNGPAACGVWKSSTREATAESVAELGKVLQPEDTLWVIVLGHTHFDGRHSMLNLPGRDMRDDEFGKLFKDLDCREQVFFITTPTSGHFIKHLSAKGRIIITATEADTEINDTMFHLDLAEVLSNPPEKPQFDLDKNGLVSLFDLYLTVVRRVMGRYAAEESIPTEHAQLDDNGDGRGTELQMDYLEKRLGGRAGAGSPARPRLSGDGVLAATVELGLRPVDSSEKPVSSGAENPFRVVSPPNASNSFQERQSNQVDEVNRDD